MNKPTITTKISNGIGNNIFQYVFTRLLCEQHGSQLSFKYRPTYYGLKFFSDFGIDLPKIGKNKNFPTKTIGKSFRHESLFNPSYKNFNINLSGHFENYELYKKHIPRISSWFKQDIPKNNDDIVLHLRLGDRLMYKVSYDHNMKIEPQEYISVIKRFSFDKLHIVTDMHVWDYVTEEMVNAMAFHCKTNSAICVKPKVAAMYFNSLIEEFKPLNPKIYLNDFGYSKAFNLIRSFDKIIFQHSTFAWWAAALSDASHVGVYGPWRPSKGAKNKNLGSTDYDGWFSWFKTS